MPGKRELKSVIGVLELSDIDRNKQGDRMSKYSKEVYTNEQENFKMPPKLKRALKKASIKKEISKSLIMRTALENWLDINFPGWRDDR